MHIRFVRLVLVLAAVGAQCAFAQNYPTRPIRLVVASSPGGASDILARLLAQKLGEQFKEQIVVDNRGGASGILGTDIVAKATPDGYTLLIIQPSLTINPNVFRKLPYDAVRDFAPISQVVDAAQMLSVSPSLAAKSVKDLIALAKAKPGQLTFGSPGFGASPHLTAELFKHKAGVDMQQVIFKGSGPAYVSLISGEISAMFATALSMMPHVKTGRIRPLAVTTLKRLAILPDVPTLAEAALPGFKTSQWFGFLAPAGTPGPVVDRIHQALVRGAGSPDVKSRLAAQGVDVVTTSPKEFANLIRQELAQWAGVVKAAGIKPN
ncbi:MAG: tripartite tricarboxylate transporter substrate binding protein [Betaproteobacteria bacterium]|nr:tripartite tricarboxylate transporter substrate binding protein [Betaproteobacteria bacterium]